MLLKYLGRLCGILSQDLFNIHPAKLTGFVTFDLVC